MRYEVNSAQVAEYVESVANRETAWRVLSGALTDRRVRHRMELLRNADFIWEQKTQASGIAGQNAAFVARADQLAEVIEASVISIAQESAGFWEQLGAMVRKGKGGGFWRLGADAVGHLRDSLLAGQEQALVLGRHPLTLPCLAPATASATAELSLRRQSVTTADGVRIEFQQLPGAASRLRVLVDASAITETDATPVISERFPTADMGNLGYNVAFLTLEEGIDIPPDRHILVVMLNQEGRGYTDYTVASGAFVTGGGVPTGWGIAHNTAGGDTGEDSGTLPAPRALCSLVAATLSRLPGKFEEDS